MQKTIVITGAGVGLGRALAKRFAELGHQVVLLGRTFAKVEATAADIGDNAMAVQCDVGNPDSVREAFTCITERHNNIDVLINNAAVFEPFLMANATDAQIISAVNTNLIGPMLMARSAIPLLKDGSQIFNISSESVEMDFPHLSVYQATKAGVERLSKSLYSELAPQGIRVTNVRAGQMYEEGKVWDANPEDQMAFGKAAMERGFNLRERPMSQFDSVADIFCHLIELPADVHADSISLHGRKAN